MRRGATVGRWLSGITVAGCCSVIEAVPAAIAGISVSVIGTIIGIVLPTTTTTTVYSLATNDCYVHSGKFLMLEAGLRARICYKSLQLYPDANLDGLSDTYDMPETATITYYREISHYANLVEYEP